MVPRLQSIRPGLFWGQSDPCLASARRVQSDGVDIRPRINSAAAHLEAQGFGLDEHECEVRWIPARTRSKLWSDAVCGLAKSSAEVAEAWFYDFLRSLRMSRLASKINVEAIPLTEATR
jgi:hypothetical protein